MSTKNTPPPPDPEIMRDGDALLVFHAFAWLAEAFVRELAARSDARLDWGYVGGRAVVKHLGDAESRARVLAQIDGLLDEVRGMTGVSVIG